VPAAEQYEPAAQPMKWFGVTSPHLHSGSIQTGGTWLVPQTVSPSIDCSQMQEPVDPHEDPTVLVEQAGVAVQEKATKSYEQTNGVGPLA